MILERTNENINKAESSRMMDAQIGFADALQRVPSDDGGRYLEFRGWIRHDPDAERGNVQPSYWIDMFEVMRHHLDCQPGGVGGETARLRDLRSLGILENPRVGGFT